MSSATFLINRWRCCQSNKHRCARTIKTMENTHPPKIFRKNENKVALSEVEEKLKVMRQKRLSRLSTFIDEQNKLFEERSIKNDAMEEAIFTIQQSAPEKVKFSIKPIAEDKSEEEHGDVGQKKKVVRTKKLFERFSCVGQGFDDDEDDEEEEHDAKLRRDDHHQSMIRGTLTLHRKSKEFKKDEQSNTAADSRTIDKDFARAGDKLEGLANRNDRKFTYGAWTPQKKSTDPDLDGQSQNDESEHELFSKGKVNLEKNNVFHQIAYGNLLPKKKSNETKTNEEQRKNSVPHRSPVEKSNSFTSSNEVIKNFSTLESTGSQSSENLNTTYVTLTFPRKPKPTKIQDHNVHNIKKDHSEVQMNVGHEIKNPSSELEDKTVAAEKSGDTVKENEYDLVVLKENKMFHKADEVEETLTLVSKENESIDNASKKINQHEIESRECVRSNETDEIKLALKKQSESDSSKCGISNPKSPVPTPRKVGVEYNTVLDFQTNMLHLTRNGDMQGDDIEEFNSCYKKMSILLEDYRKKMLEVERKKSPRRRLNQIKGSMKLVDQRIKRYRGLKRDAEYLEIKDVLSGFFLEISKINVDEFETKEEKDELLKRVDHCAKKLVKKAVKNESAMIELFKDQVDLITAKRVVGTFI